MPKVEYRHPTVEDLKAILDIVNASNTDNPLWEVYSPDEFLKTTFENDDWEAKGHWVAVRGGKLLGYGGARIYQRNLDAGKNDGWLGVWVLPEERARGVEGEIMQRSVDFLRERGIAKAKYFDLKGVEWRDAIRHDFGFTVVHREFFLMKKDKKLPEIKEVWGLGFREFLLSEATDPQLEELMHIVNDSFSEDPTYSPNTVESLSRWKEASQNIVRINFATLKDKVVGVCISEIEVEYNKRHKTKAGWIRIFGVSKPHRNKGIGKALLHNGMRWHWDQGMETLYVGVDEMNPPAERVYRCAGFRMQDEGAIWSLDL